jgi:hypothetical protein
MGLTTQSNYLRLLLFHRCVAIFRDIAEQAEAAIQTAMLDS